MPSSPQEARQISVIGAALLRDFGAFLPASSHPDPGERDRNLKSRSLAALVVRNRLDCDSAVAAEAVTDGQEDFGIDALAISAGTPRVWLVQSKWNKDGRANFRESDVMTLDDGLRRIDNRNFDRFNERLRAHVTRLRAAWSDSDLRVTIVLALMRREPLHENVILRLDEVRENFNQYGSYVDYEVLYLADIWDMVRKSAEPEPIDLEVQLDHWFDLSVPMKAVNGAVDVGQVADWYAAHGDSLFSKNIRESLGKTQVNADIERTLAEDPHGFWYRNNGITMLCDSVRLTPLSRAAPHGLAKVKIEGASIINGAQTVASIASAMRAEGDAAGGAMVGIRIIESQDPASSSAITKSTNTQNHIERRDFVALDPVQLEIREEFRLALGLTYAIRRSEFEPSPESGCTVREAAIALACAHPRPDIAVRIRHNEDLLWEDDASGAYNRLFSGPPEALQIWRSVLLLRRVRDALHKVTAGFEGRASAIAEQSTLVVAHIVFQALGQDVVDDPSADWDEVLAQVPATTTNVIRWLINDVDGSYGTKSFITGIFSSNERVLHLTTQVLASIVAGAEAPPLGGDYVGVPRRRSPRRKNAVALIIDAGRIKDGTPLSFRPRTGPERIALEAWLKEDPRRGSVSWANSRSRPLVWAVDGERYSPSGLVMTMWSRAGWTGSPVAVQGPARWYLSDKVNLVSVARGLEDEGSDDDLEE